MSLYTLTVAGQTVTAVSMPSSPAFAATEWEFTDAVALNRSPFTGQTQTYTWPGADAWSGTLTLPKLSQAVAAQWKAFLMECRGMARPFLLGDLLQPTPSGVPVGTPLIDNSTAGSNQPGMTMLNTTGWAASTGGLLLPGDYVQVGYRLHVNLNTVGSDSSGKAALELWPSLREVPVNSSVLVTSNAAGLFRRADNKATWSASVADGVGAKALTSLSFRIMEYR